MILIVIKYYFVKYVVNQGQPKTNDRSHFLWCWQGLQQHIPSVEIPETEAPHQLTEDVTRTTDICPFSYKLHKRRIFVFIFN